MNDTNQQKIAEITERLKKKIEEKEDTAVYHLPFWQQDKRGAPNSFLRSALFAAIQSKDRIFIKDKTLFSQQGITVKFTGERLNQEDMSVWLALVDLARKHPLGTRCSFTSYEILKHLGLEDSGDQRKVLYSAVVRLNACSIQVGNGRYIYGGSLVDDFMIDEQTKHFTLNLNKKLINIFGDNDWTSLDFGQRKELRQKPLAQKLHEYYSSHERPLPVTIEFLHKLVGSANKAIRSFKPRLKAALEELITIGFLASYKIEGDKVTVERKFSRALPQTKTRE